MRDLAIVKEQRQWGYITLETVAAD